ncbi:TIGR02530 family flagellar biosynthesis protein [Pseudalkalibacillus salsuginis]|uniref:TIGR02530 family flagellar biosynthesis protein n=1 Tax=Pseudalkalibacillus salsuginis TaxID=2910972 RepID=UPI001F1E4A7F|nr:TIGR02530 family flagellar biosynthesis protein [Pseudalkalibacillus salsuginis]MCF6410572.1 flagellar operon protein [Pseudalkalibacillus salsuginis]
MQRVYQPPITSVISPRNKVINKKEQAATNFQELLHDQVKGLKISKHAHTRLAERAIRIEETTWDRIYQKVSEAKHKGIKDSLVLVGEAALVVNTTNNTVITAMNRQEASDHIFTNINGAIVMN